MIENEIGTYIDPLSDFGFKRIFGNEPHKALLIAFLNEIFRGKKQITDLVYNQNEFPGEHKESGTVIFDLLCTTDQGEQILIEVQKSKQEHFFQRALFYGSRLISAQIPVGQRKDWSYRFSGVYVIALVDGFKLSQELSDHYLHHICLCERNGGNFVYDDFGLFFIELLKFDKQEWELETELEKWLYVLKHISKLEKLPLMLRKPVFEKLFDIAAYVNLSEEEKTMYDISLKRIWDEESVRSTMMNEIRAEMAIEIEQAKEEAEKAQSEVEKAQSEVEKAQAEVEKARLEAENAKEEVLRTKAEALKEGREVGLAEGKMVEMVSIARKLKQMNFVIPSIIEITGLSEERIQKL